MTFERAFLLACEEGLGASTFAALVEEAHHRLATLRPTKHCGRCKTAHAREHFHRNQNSPDGLQGWCKMCSHDYRRIRYARDAAAREAAA